MTIGQDYLDDVIAKIARVRDTQADNIAAAANICADSIEGDGLVFTFGTGHGGFAALESFPRTGGVTGFRPIVESSIALMHHVLGDQGTAQYRFMHTQEGYGRPSSARTSCGTATRSSSSATRASTPSSSTWRSSSRSAGSR